MSLRAPALFALLLLLGCGDDTGSGGQGGDGPSGGGGSGAGVEAGGGAGAGSAGGPTDGGGGAGAGDDGGGGFGAGLPDGPSSDRLNLRPIGTVEGANLGYAEYLPPGYGDGHNYPLLVFHHGIGESGDGSAEQLDRLFNTGLPPIIESDNWPSDRPFIVLMTQHMAPPNTSCHSVEEITNFLAFATEHYDVDLSRVYLTGLSCGAIGSWNYLAAHTDEVVAAAALIAGDGRGAFNQAGCDLGKVALWAFHGDADNVVTVAGSVDPIEDLQACTDPEAVEAKITIYPDVGHDSWTRTYNLSAGHDPYAWLLTHQK